MNHFDVSTPEQWAAYKRYAHAVREWIGSDILYERYMDGLIDIDKDGNIVESEF